LKHGLFTASAIEANTGGGGVTLSLPVETAELASLPTSVVVSCHVPDRSVSAEATFFRSAVHPLLPIREMTADLDPNLPFVSSLR
jgi:hypothetical protein